MGLISWLFRRGHSHAAPARPAFPPEHAAAADGIPPRDSEAAGMHWTERLAAFALPTHALPAPQYARLLPDVEAALLRMVQEPVRLPRRPQLLPQLLGMLNDDRASGRQIAEVIGRDPALATNLLRVANSPMYRVHATTVESLDRAVALVGTDGLRQLVSVALMQPVMRVDGGATGCLPERVWEHTELAAGLAARMAAGRGPDAVFAAQMLSLLQGLGSILVVQALGDACVRLQCEAPDARLAGELLQRWGMRIGRGIAQAWELPSIAGLRGLAPGSELELLLDAAGRAAVDAMQQEPATR